MTPAEMTQILALVETLCPSQRQDERVAATDASWRPLLQDLDATEVRVAMVRLARRQGDIGPREVRAEVLARRRRPPLVALSPFDPAPDSRRDLLALRVPCPWCGAAPGRPCTIAGSDTPLRKSVAHPARLAIARRNAS